MLSFIQFETQFLHSGLRIESWVNHLEAEIVSLQKQLSSLNEIEIPPKQHALALKHSF